jgi:hypothetical protein
MMFSKYWCLCLALAAVFVALIATVPESAAATCTNASIKGKYGIFINGYDSSGLYQHGVGQINSNGAGSFTGVETVSDDGTIFNNLSLTGTYSLAPNCTGSGTIINVKNGNQSHYNFVVDAAGKQVEVAATDSGHGTASGYALALGATTCSKSTVAGTYGFHGGGFLVGQGELQFDGQFVLNGTGGMSGIETRNVSGTVISAGAVTGTYTASANCTGTIKYQFNGATVNLNTYFVNGQKSFFAIETDSGTVASAIFQQ